MRFSLDITKRFATHIFRNKREARRNGKNGDHKFALVLQLEPLHTCNLTCTGCGRIREYSTNLKDMMPLEDCLGAAKECDAPMVSICGGEPLIYPKIEELVDGLIADGRIVYICTNGMFMRKKMVEHLARTYKPHYEPILNRLLAEKLITDKQAEEIRKGKNDGRPSIAPHKRLFWNVHLDATEKVHDIIVEREGVFRECIEAIKMAKILDYLVATNTTVYQQTDMDELDKMFTFLRALGVDGHTISPGYEYDAAKKDMVTRLNAKPEDFFLTRKLTNEKFKDIVEWGNRYTFFGSPAYLEFLAGMRDMHCTAWAIPTRNVRGWKAPCYLMTDGHYATYRELIEKTDWDKYGVFDGVARDPRCENCMVHCGYEPTVSLGYDTKPGDLWKLVKYNFGASPNKRLNGNGNGHVKHEEIYNGVTTGNGHETGKQGQTPNPKSTASAAFSR